MKSERSLAPVSTTNWYFKRFVSFSSPRPIRKKHTDRVFLQALCESLDQACQPLDQACRCLYIAHLSRTCSTLISSTEYKSFGFPAYVRRCIDMLCTLISHRRAVCRGNLVFCCTHRNLSVHRPNTNHSDSLHTS